MNECVLASSSGDNIVSVHVWDPRTGTCLMTYREGGILKNRSLSLLGNDYVIAVEKLKPLLRIWPINSQKPVSAPRLLCTGKVTAMAPSPDAAYIAVAVDEKLHMYQVASGFLLGTGVRHFQPITVVRWCVEGSRLACGGDDGIVTVWNLAVLVTKGEAQPEPEHTFSDHSLPVADIIITGGRSHARLISVSADRTCKIYGLATGKILLSIVFNEMLTSVAVSLTEVNVFVGTASGNIYQVSLQMPFSSIEYHTAENDGKTNVLSGHTKVVSCLSCSQDGISLLSGSHDESVKIWHISSRQCLRTIQMKGPVTNAVFARVAKEMFENEVKRNVILHPFQKSVSSEEEVEFCIEIMATHDIASEWNTVNGLTRSVALSKIRSDDGEKESTDNLQHEVDRLRGINEQLYKFTIEKLLQRRCEPDEYGSNLCNSSSNVSKDRDVDDGEEDEDDYEDEGEDEYEEEIEDEHVDNDFYEMETENLEAKDEEYNEGEAISNNVQLKSKKKNKTPLNKTTLSKKQNSNNERDRVTKLWEEDEQWFEEDDKKSQTKFASPGIGKSNVNQKINSRTSKVLKKPKAAKNNRWEVSPGTKLNKKKKKKVAE